MPDANDPTKVRQGRLGKQVLVILAVSLALAVVAAWVLWGVYVEDADTVAPAAFSVPAEEPGMATPVQQPILSASSSAD